MKSNAKRRIGESSGQTVVKKVRHIMEDSTKAGAQKRDGHGSILHYIYKSTLGESIHCQMRKCLQVPFVRSLESYGLHRTASPFNRRITALEWHPTHPTTLAVGSKGGDIMLWNFDALNKTTFIQGATWHPVYDLIVVGRYPDERVCPSDLRTVDVYDANSGVNVLIWKRDSSPLSKQRKATEGGEASRVTSARTQLGRRPQRPSREGRTSAAAGDASLRKKLSSLEDLKTRARTRSKSTEKAKAPKGKKK
ncbi:hypothetical protein NHX12_002620 [Muraenolepis orangiensis]|uniref:Damage-specific DNA-binding protein 2 n=1 Tax=Muraenolepis orangiensis TaxID=630683 RepID=A0A9Q0DX81_9TELE|nr:hypothetical protein NHX12_002620 [Muraenolepis orangiensis]